MKKGRKSSFIIFAVFLLTFSYLAVFGLSNYRADTKKVYFRGIEDIRWGIDIQGGVEAIFKPETSSAVTADDLKKAETIINTRLTNINITDSEVFRDEQNKQIIVRFPWKVGESDFDPQAAIEELGEMAVLKFCEGTTGPVDDPDSVILSGTDVQKASSGYDEKEGKHIVLLQFKASGKSKFADATTKLAASGGSISIWLDENPISSATVQNAITDGNAQISGSFTADEAVELAEKINAGSLPFKLSADDSKIKIISPTLGQASLQVMLVAGVIAFALIVLMMFLLYRIPGFIGAISITAQIAGIFACVSKFFPFASGSATLTIPGIAGIILSIGMGVDANVITAERIKEEIRNGKTIDGSIAAGFEHGFSAILDGNVTVVIVAAILMGAFGPSGDIWATILSPLFFLFPSTISGSIHSFGYTLFLGMIFNMLVGVYCTRVMMRGISRFKALRNPFFFGGYRNEK